jgi:hypothetical protein
MRRPGSHPRTNAGAYDGPVGVAVLEFAGRSIRLMRPEDPDRLLGAPDVLARSEREDYMPYWAYLWPAASLLAEAVAREPWRGGLRALEIGCGLGLAGLVGLAVGMRVDFTDYDEAALRFVARSAAENGFDPASYSTGRLDWREPPDRRYPVILGADVLYERRLVPLVVGRAGPHARARRPGADRRAVPGRDRGLRAVPGRGGAAVRGPAGDREGRGG